MTTVHKPPSIIDAIRDLMRDGQWRSPYEVRRLIEPVIGRWASDVSVTGRLRDLRKEGLVDIRFVRRGLYEYQWVPKLGQQSLF